jgi:hypothetical protein
MSLLIVLVLAGGLLFGVVLVGVILAIVLKRKE